MLRHNIEIVAFRVQRRNIQFLALLPIIPVIVVGTEDSNILIAQNLGNASTKRRLTRGAISYYSQDNGTPNPYNGRTLNSYRR
jgi:hypothetical protein